MRRAVAAALGRDCEVKVFCPSQHERFITPSEMQQGFYWPKQKTSETLLKIIQRRKISVWLASDQICESMQDYLSPLLKANRLGGDAQQQLELLPKQLGKVFRERGIPFDQDRFNQEFVILKIEILKWVLIKVVRRRVGLLRCHLDTRMPLNNFNLKLAHLFAEEETIQKLLDELEAKKNA